MAGSQTVLSILDEAAAAIGGWTALQTIKSVHLESEGQDWEPWQAYDIGGTVDVSTFRIATDLDLGAGASRVEMDAEVVYPWPHRVAYIEITDAEAGITDDLSPGVVSRTPPLPTLLTSMRRYFSAFSPHRLQISLPEAPSCLRTTNDRCPQ